MEKISVAKQKWVKSLHLKKYREKYGYFIGEGNKLLVEILHNKIWHPSMLIATPEWYERNEALTKFITNTELLAIDQQDVKNISAQTTPQLPVMIFQKPRQEVKSEIIKTQSLIFYLDGVRDPGNLGTIIRTADWFGHDYLLCSMDTVDWTNPKVIQATMGSFSRVNILHIDPASLKGGEWGERQILGAALSGQPVREYNLDNVIVVIGNESSGISLPCQQIVDQNIMIPGESGRAESLNAAFASAIICYENFTQKEQKANLT